MPKFFKENFEQAPFIDGLDASHISKVLRMKPGEFLTVCDTKGFDYECVITESRPELVSLKVEEKHRNETEPQTKLTLFQCLPKSDKMDLIVRQATEIGAEAVIPVLSERCVSRPDPKSAAKKIARWQKIAFSAAGQCGRGVIPQIKELITFKKSVEMFNDFDKVIFFCERGGKRLSDIVDGAARKIAIFVGPEGGFSVEEEELANSFSAVSATLGKRILRCETAPLAAAACVMLLSGEMD